MKKFCIFLFFCISFSGSIFSQQSHIPGEVMVMLNPKENVKTMVSGLNFLHAGANFHISKEVTAEWNIWLLSFDNQFITDESALLMISQYAGVTMAQYNYPVESRVTMANDTLFGRQWGLNNTGQDGGLFDADVDAPEAWDITTGGTTVQGDEIVVAVIDGGFQGNHPDLIDNFWVNSAEIDGNGIDDDGNGYIDDVNGWNAYTNSDSLPISQHGTHVAGIIGAKGNNITGVSGVNWNVKIMRVAGSSTNSATVVTAYAYVAKQRKIYNQTNGAEGAFVVATNSSFGVNNGSPANFPIWCAMYDTLGSLGILNAGAGPNNNVNVDNVGDIPSTCPSLYLVAVTNTTRNDTKATSAGFGIVNMDIGAPGSEIYSTVINNNYSNLTGTSMATPHVAGAIGLYYSAACTDFITNYKAAPHVYALMMRNFLLSGIDSTAAMANTTSSKGRLNLLKGIQRVQAGCNAIPPLAPVAAFTISDSQICAGESIIFTDQSTNFPQAWSWSFPGGSPSFSSVQNPFITYDSAGTYHVTLTTYNLGGYDVEVQNMAITVSANPTAPTVMDNGGSFQSSYNFGNQWYDENGAVAGAILSSFTPLSNGLYYVIHTDANGCISPASEPVLLNAGINEIDLEGISVYPNPIGNQFTVSWKPGLEVKNVRLYDVIGKLVYQSNATANQALVIQTDKLSPGNYTLELITSKGIVKKKLVK